MKHQILRTADEENLFLRSKKKKKIKKILQKRLIPTCLVIKKT